MRRRRFLITAVAATFSTLTGTALAQEKIEGKVISTKLTVCQFKPGGCEGTMVLETAKPEQVTIKVPLGTMIQKGTETVFLPALRGRTVSVTHVTEKGERIARAIDVK
ncbi:MAG: hypothetical protein HYX46_09660 [Betaproteobacteria bacterium]|nr:hypothetical protein [Betaproteobacteria bacterium]